MINFAKVCKLDGALAAAGFHAFTPWWNETFGRFYNHPTAKQLVVRAGRGSGKSFGSCKIGVTEGLLGDWSVPQGERHYFIFVSISKEEAAQRLTLVQAMLRALGVPFEVSGFEVRLVNKPIGFLVLANQVGAVSGWRCIGYSLDECAKYVHGANYVGNAAEVAASANAMCTTHAASARRLLISSPLGLLDFHAQQFALGNTASQVVAHAPTWIANPGAATEASTRLLEPDERVWRREYAAEPASAINAALDREDVEAAFAPLPIEGGRILGYVPPSKWVGVEDPSSLQGDSYTWCRVGVLRPDTTPRELKLAIGDKYPVKSIDADGKVTIGEAIANSPMRRCDEQGRPLLAPVPTSPLLRITEIGSVDGRVTGTISMADIVKRITRELQVKTIFSDQREEASLQALHQRHGVDFKSIVWTNERKQQALATLRRMLREHAISIEAGPSADRLKEQLLGLEEKLLPSGLWTYGARRGSHDDFAALLVTACMAINERMMPNAESWVSTHRTTWSASDNGFINPQY